MKSIFLSLSKFFLIASLFSVIIVTHFTIFPFVVGKIIFFRVMVELALLFFALAVIASERSERGNLLMRLLRSFHSLAMTNKIVSAVTIFVVIFSLSGFLGADSANSFWSNYVRGEGIFQMWHYYAFFILVVLLFRDEKDWRRLLVFFITAGGLSLLLGIIPWLQAYHMDTRFKGAIGNPAFTAVYLLFMLFFSLYLLVNLKLRITDYGLSKKILLSIRNPQFVIFLIALVFVFLTGTRGAFLGLMAGGIVAILITGLRKGLKFLKFKSLAKAIISLVAGICALGLLFYFQPFRIFQISFKEETAQTRFWIWQSAFKGWRERPILGWGSENFSEVFDKYFDQRHGSADEGKEVWIDRAHSVFFGYLAETGILGLLAYLGIWAAYYFKLFGSFGWNSDKLGSRLLFLIFPFVYLVQGSFIFELLPAYIGLFVLLALVNFSFINPNFKDQMSKQAQNPKPQNFWKFGIWILLFGFLIYFGSYRPFVKSILFNNALAKVDQISSVEEFKNNFDRTLNYYSPYGQREELRMLGGVIMDLQKKNPPSEVNKALAGYLNENYNSIKNLGAQPQYQNKVRYGAQDYYILWRVNEAAGNKELAEGFYKEAHEKWPLRLEFLIPKP